MNLQTNQCSALILPTLPQGHALSYLFCTSCTQTLSILPEILQLVSQDSKPGSLTPEPDSQPLHSTVSVYHNVDSI